MIRKINKNDFDKITNLGLEYDKEFSNHYNLDIYLNNDVYNAIVFENESIQGFTIYTKIDSHIDIELIYVDKLFRNQKIATQMLEFLEKNNEEIMLEVAVDNIPALNLYKKMGYKVISERKGYYQGVDALVMKKVIK